MDCAVRFVERCVMQGNAFNWRSKKPERVSLPVVVFLLVVPKNAVVNPLLPWKQADQVRQAGITKRSDLH